MTNMTRNSLFSILCISFLAILTACNSDKTKTTTTVAPDTHQVSVKEVIQVTQYTYLLCTENGKDLWIAVPKMEAAAGQTYYYNGGMLMNNFTSKDLGRTFESILFVENLTTEPVTAQTGEHGSHEMGSMPGQGQGQAVTGAVPQKPTIEKVDVKLDPAPGGITIAQLYAKKAAYEGKSVKIRGQVTKVNSGIMDRNWIHMQDGTDFEGNIDLTVTSGSMFKVGDVVTFEGKISLKKDFGYGYFYEVLMEDAVAK